MKANLLTAFGDSVTEAVDTSESLEFYEFAFRRRAARSKPLLWAAMGFVGRLAFFGLRLIYDERRACGLTSAVIRGLW